MGRGTYSASKRQRDADKAAKKRAKAERRQLRRERGPGEVQIASAEEMTGPLPSIEEVMRRIEHGPEEPRTAKAIPARLFVGGLSWDTTLESLREAFEAFGPVVDAIVMTDRATGKSRGFGFVTMENRKDATRAIEALDGVELDGRQIVVNVATER